MSSRMNKEDLKKVVSKICQTPTEVHMKKLLEKSRVDLSKDYRRPIQHFCIDEDGDFVWNKVNGDTYVIESDRCKEPDWISHMFSKMDYNLFGEFVAAFLKYLEMKGVKTLNIEIRDFDRAQKFNDEK